MIHKTLALLSLFCLLLGSASCQLRQEPPAWTTDDLRLLDPLDASTPQTDIIALYTRNRGLNLEIRLDLLDIPTKADYELQIRLTTPEDDVILLIPAIGKAYVSNWRFGVGLRMERDPALDTILLHINRTFVPKGISLQAALFQTGQDLPADETALVSLEAAPPAERAPVLLAFWDVFPAATPAQALRRWSGAHTGPYGGPHGLRYLLNAIEEYELPVTLLDLLTPASLGALAFTDGALAQVQHLSNDGLLTLPEAACGQPADSALSFSHQSALDFGLTGSPFAFTCGPELQPEYMYQFIELDDPTHMARYGGQMLIPLPSLQDAQAAAEGPTLAVRRLLVETALSPDPVDLLALGGSLPDSAWGVPDLGTASFAWLAAHPWVKVLGAQDLLYSSFALEVDTPEIAVSTPEPWLAALQDAPDNAITHLAWLTTLMLTAPVEDVELQALHQAYTGQIGVLLAAADWAESPTNLADCSTDPDNDNQPECLLADDNYFAVIETNGGRLTHFFTLDESGPNQLVAPTSQFTIGLSDPSSWQPEGGDSADPGAVMGAFSDLDGTYDEYRASFTAGVLTLVGDGISKSFKLLENGIEVTYMSDSPVSFRIPLAVDPQAFYSGAGTYVSTAAPGTWTWGPEGGVQAVVQTDANLSAEGFTASKALLDLSEDPDLDYPRMHYFPFPFSLVSVSGEGEFTVSIGIK